VPTPTPHLDLDQVQDLVRERCFPSSTAALVGAEIEWLTLSRHHRHVLGFDEVEAALDDRPPLRSGSALTFEPGGQVELSSPPCQDATEACQTLADDTAMVRAALADHDIGLVGVGLDPLRPPHRVVDGARYRAMERYFEEAGNGGGAGVTMMCSTAAVQVNLDTGATADIGRRWRLAHSLGPVLAASFANSPLARGNPTGLANWSRIDQSRTAPVDQRPDWADAWVEYAMAAKVMLIRRTADDFVPLGNGLSFREWMASGHELGYPTASDFEYHLTTLFPPVRPRGWLELRYIDALPEPWWRVPVVVSSCLLDDEEASAVAAEAAARSGASWDDASRCGLVHPGLARAARTCFDAALSACPRIGIDEPTTDLVAAYQDRYVARSRCPADDRIEEWAADGRGAVQPSMEASWT
jgi:glutamate--cysteine ligase